MNCINSVIWLQTTQHTSHGVVTVVTNWMAGVAPHKSETNPGPTNTHKQVWICDIYHKQIHVRKQISIRCNMIEHWVHQICTGIRQEQYTDTWTCHLHRQSRLITHTDITPHPHPDPGPIPYPIPTYTTHTTATKHRHTSNTPPVPTGLVKPIPNPLIHSPPSPPTPPRAKQIHIPHTPPTPHTPHTTLIHNTSAALDTMPKPRQPPTCPALTTPHPSPTPALPSTSHHHTLSSDTRITVTATTAST